MLKRAKYMIVPKDKELQWLCTCREVGGTDLHQIGSQRDVPSTTQVEIR